ncbi:MAG: WD40 repeat domain-containing protein [Thermoplasmata archaeon]|nr:MAG: WD40 repeat domain-containing protein [Thermoplasmata archaeon]
MGTFTNKASAFLTFLMISCAIPFSVEGDEAIDITSLNLLWENKEGHNATLWSVRWSPDDSMISGTYFDNTTTIFNAINGSIIVKLGSHPQGRGTRCDGIQDCSGANHLPTRTSAWSPDGRYLATGGDNRLIIVYDTTDWSIAKIFEGHEGSVLTLEWSRGGSMIASGSGTDKVAMHNLPENLIKIWDFSSGEVLANLKGHQDGVMNIRWSPNGSQIASASDDKTIMLWETTNWTRTRTLIGHTLGVLDVDWSPNGTLLVSGSRDYKIRTWDAVNGEALQRWTEPNCIRSVHWHPSGELVANSGVDEVMLKIRNATTGTIMKTYTESADTKSVVMSSRWSSDGRKLAAGAGKEHTLRVYSFGVSAPEEEEVIPSWLPGTILFVVIAAIGVSLLLIPIRPKLRESGR